MKCDEILKKLETNRYLSVVKKTQTVQPTQLGEMIFDTVLCSIRPLLNAELTASWELGLSKTAEGTITADEYMAKLDDFIRRRVASVKETDSRPWLRQAFAHTAPFYKTWQETGTVKKTKGSRKASANKKAAEKKEEDA